MHTYVCVPMRGHMHGCPCVHSSGMCTHVCHEPGTCACSSVTCARGSAECDVYASIRICVHLHVLHMCAYSTRAFASATSSGIIHVEEGELDAG